MRQFSILAFAYCAYRAAAFACTAIDAGVGVYNELTVALGNCAYGTSSCARTAANAIIRNYTSHNNSFLLVKILIYFSTYSPEFQEFWAFLRQLVQNIFKVLFAARLFFYVHFVFELDVGKREVFYHGIFAFDDLDLDDAF